MLLLKYGIHSIKWNKNGHIIHIYSFSRKYDDVYKILADYLLSLISIQ